MGTEIETHPAFVHVDYYESSPERMAGDGERIGKMVRRRGETIAGHRRLKWARKDKNQEWLPDHAQTREQERTSSLFYKPRVFAAWGPFDLLACYLTPSVSPLGADLEQQVTGHHVEVGLMPRWNPKAEKPTSYSEDRDPNHRYMQLFRHDHPEGGRLVYPFFCAIRCKLNVAVVCPDLSHERDHEAGSKPDGAPAQDATKGLALVLDMVFERTTAWEEQYGGVAAVALGIGWNEVTILAHAFRPEHLLQLAIRIRQEVGDARLFTSTEEDSLAHVFAATVTTFGYEHLIRSQAENLYNQAVLAEDAAWPTDDSGRLRFGNEMWELAWHVADGWMQAGEEMSSDARERSRVARAGATATEVRGTYVQPALHAYPGHERDLLTCLEIVRIWLDDWSPPGAPAAQGPAIEVGKQDVLGVRLYLELFAWGRDRANRNEEPWAKEAVAGMALQALIQIWMQYGGKRPEDGLHCYFDTKTRIGWDSRAVGATRGEGAYDGPYRQIGLRDFDRARHTKGQFADGLRLRSLETSAIAREVKACLRVLQTPFALTDQVQNMLSTFLWAWDQPMLREEVVELAPLIHCMHAYLVANAQELSRLARGDKPPGFGPLSELTRGTPDWKVHPRTYRTRRVYKAVQDIETGLDGLVEAFRTTFNNRHLTGYLSDGVVDLNLRFRGSRHQLLTVANMLLESLLWSLMGPRACVSVIGPAQPAHISRKCDVACVALSSDSLDEPLQLENLGHEVGHRLLQSLISLAHAPDEGEERAPFELMHRWKQPAPHFAEDEEFLRAVHDLDLLTGHQLANEEGTFGQAFSDYIEYLVLGYEGADRDRGIREWTRSHMLRKTLVARAYDVRVDKSTERRRWPRTLRELLGDETFALPEVPIALEWGGIKRVAFVWLMARTVDTAIELSADKDLAFRTLIEQVDGEFSALRTFLRTRCIVGFSPRARELLTDDEKWDSFMHGVRGKMDWLWTQDFCQAFMYFGATLKERIGSALNPDHETEHPRSPTAIWRVGSEKLRALSRELNEAIMPCALLRQWMDASELEQWLEELERPVEEREHPPWRSRIQPFDRENGAGNKLRALVLQRGAIVALTPEIEERLAGLRARFYGGLLPLVPTWRASLLSRVSQVENTNGT